MCFFRKKKVKSTSSDSEPFGLEKRQKDAEIIASNVKVGDKYRRRWHKRVDDITLHIATDYTVTRIEGNLITFEAPSEEPLQFTMEELKSSVFFLHQFTKIS